MEPVALRKKTSMKAGEISEKEVKFRVDALKMQQNHEMLLVLQEEQANEASRDEIYRKTLDSKEKKKLETLFAGKREKALARIGDLSRYFNIISYIFLEKSRQHEKNLEKLKISLGNGKNA